MAEDRVRAHVLVDGVVQGVFFRSETRRMATAFALDGWVRNLPDGKVEAVFEGPPDRVRNAVQWMHDGPPHAHVTNVDTSWEEPEETLGFSIR